MESLRDPLKVSGWAKKSINKPLVQIVDNYYVQLENLLISGKWRSADEETSSIMLKLTSRVDAGWLREQDFASLSCFDLETIDALWTKHSQGRFGFTAQSQVWKTVGEDYTKFSDAVGWRLSYKWQCYSQLKFNLEAPLGHLPAAPFYKLSDEIAIGWAAVMLKKLVDCADESF